ncbi:MAG: TIGR00730 family Rossman fold protein [Labilithrix sp.]|nr:TIGR00730 family Rossman fold protein [Labilithrix sp.]MCW5831885.1 TIGR00730 family Rossman fold protein [Labilithrix sp.]
MSERELRSICVFCGSRPGGSPAFLAAGAAMGRAVAARGLTLVYGGARVGVMGAVADAALAAGGRVVGVIPKSLVSKEIAHDGLSELFLTETMHDRKDRMIGLSDAFVALPGGFGTYDELFETITLAQLGLHEKPNALLDTEGFFQPLVALMRHTIEQDFAAPEHAGLLVIEREPERLLDALAAWTPPPLGSKALDRRGSP